MVFYDKQKRSRIVKNACKSSVAAKIEPCPYNDHHSTC